MRTIVFFFVSLVVHIITVLRALFQLCFIAAIDGVSLYCSGPLGLFSILCLLVYDASCSSSSTAWCNGQWHSRLVGGVMALAINHFA